MAPQEAQVSTDASPKASGGFAIFDLPGELRHRSPSPPVRWGACRRAAHARTMWAADTSRRARYVS
jgi:hypothetical protein